MAFKRAWPTLSQRGGLLTLEKVFFIPSISYSLFHTLIELIHDKFYGNRQEAKTDISDYIEIFYNRQHRHSYLGYLNPVDFEKRFAA